MTLRAAHGNLYGAIQHAEAMEAELAFEDRTRRAVAKNAEIYAIGLQELHDLTTRISKLGPRLAEALLAIEHIDTQARERGRPDLRFSVETLRNVIRRELGAPEPCNSSAVLERMGESDADWDARVIEVLAEYARGAYHSSPTATSGRVIKSRLRRAKEMFVEREEGEDDGAYNARLWSSVAQCLNCHRARGEDKNAYITRLRNALAHNLKIERRGERDEAYQLRISNAHAQRHRSTEGQDPLSEVARAAVPVIQAHCATAAQWEKYRHVQRLHRIIPPR